MAALTLDIKNLDKVLAEIKAYPQDVDKIITNEFRAFGGNVRNDAVRFSPIDEGKLRGSISTETTNLQVSISVNVDYAAYLEFGTKSFAAAYVSSLPPEWQSFAAQYKGGGGGNFKEFVARLVKGIKPHPYLYPAFEKNKQDLINHLKQQLNAK
jgi:HK97 gp10 family phage protein